MSINNSYEIQIIESDGETTHYNFNFFIFKKEDLKIKVMDDKADITELEYNNDYTVENSFDYYNGGYFNLNTPQKKGLYMVIYRETPIDQQINLLSLQAISPMNLTKMFDKLTVICQELNEQFYRSMKFDFTDISIIDQNKPLNETNIKNIDTADNKNLTVAITLKYNEETNKWELSTSRTNPDETRDQGSEDMLGVYKIASQEEVNIGEDDTKVITPLKLENKINDKINTYTQETLIPNAILQYDEDTNYSKGQPCYTILNNKPTFYYSLQDNNLNNPILNTDYWEEIKFGNGGGNYPLGSIITTTIPVIDPNLHLPDGTQITKTGGHKEFYFYMESIKDTHPEIFCTLDQYNKDITKTGNCARYVITDDYVKLPTINGWIESINDINNIGKVNEAGLPNITGTFDATVGIHVKATRAIKLKNLENSNWWYKDVSVNRSGNYELNASSSSVIYGKSTTVQPKGAKLLIYIVIGNYTGEQQNVSNVNNVSPETIINTAWGSLQTEDNTKVGYFTRINQGGNSYTVPAGGTWFVSLTFCTLNGELIFAAGSGGHIVEGGTTIQGDTRAGDVFGFAIKIK